MNVPLVDLKIQHRKLRRELDQAWSETLEQGNFILGPAVQKFEEAFARYLGTPFAVGVASGTDAAHLALRAVGVGRGHEVIVPVNTFAATALAVSYCGARIRFVDVDETTHVLDLDTVKRQFSLETRAVMAVHLYGRVVPEIEAIVRMAREKGAAVIEDAAQAHGARLGERMAGTFGDFGAFSFYPGKNLGCLGDGGAVVTANAELAQHLKALRNYGAPKKYHHPVVGFNSRLDSLQAAVLSVKLQYLDEFNLRRREWAGRYTEALSGIGDLQLPEGTSANAHAWHLYVIQTSQREALLDHLQKQQVGALIHYPIPLHLQGAFRDLEHRPGDFPVAEKLCARILSLPLFPEMTEDQFNQVVGAVKGFFGKRA